MRRAICTAAVFATLLSVTAEARVKKSSGEGFLPSDADVRKMLAERVDTLAGQEDGIGIVVGIIGPQGRRVISYGHPRQGNPRSLTGETVFEIGSVSKVFTALLLADMVGKGEVALSDPVANYLPADVKVPQRNGTSITLLDLVTHTSGLPFMTDEMPVYNDPTTTKYTAARLYQQHCHHTDAEAGGEACNRSQCGFAACAILLFCLDL